MHKKDKFPSTICFSCESNLEMLIEFKNTCIQSANDKGSTVRQCLDIKIDGDSSDDFNWKEECRASGLMSDDDDVDNERQPSNPEEKRPINVDEASPCGKKDMELVILLIFN